MYDRIRLLPNADWLKRFHSNLDGACWQIVTFSLHLGTRKLIWTQCYYFLSFLPDVALHPKRKTTLHPPPSRRHLPHRRPPHPCWQRSRCNGSRSGRRGLRPIENQVECQPDSFESIRYEWYPDESELGIAGDKYVNIGLEVRASPHCQDRHFHLGRIIMEQTVSDSALTKRSTPILWRRIKLFAFILKSI